MCFHSVPSVVVMNVVYMPTAFDSAILLTYDVPETIGLIVGKGKVFCMPNVVTFTLPD